MLRSETLLELFNIRHKVSDIVIQTVCEYLEEYSIVTDLIENFDMFIYLTISKDGSEGRIVIDRMNKQLILEVTGFIPTRGGLPAIVETFTCYAKTMIIAE
jgi:hypothetical protein